MGFVGAPAQQIVQQDARLADVAQPTRGVDIGARAEIYQRLRDLCSAGVGIVVVPGDRTECLDCHTSLAPPFPLLPGVEPITETDPVLFDVEISGINIEGFPNNGLFTSAWTVFVSWISGL